MKVPADIRPITNLNSAELQRLIVGYTSHAKYLVRKTESDEQVAITLERHDLPEPYVKRFAPLDTNTVTCYLRMLRNGFCLGAFEEDHLVGLSLAEPHHWNRSLRVIELHIAGSHQGRGLGRRLLDALTEKALDAELRNLVCETQNTNVPAIDFYRKLGFALEAIDLSLYSNEDLPDGEIAVFMKKRL